MKWISVIMMSLLAQVAFAQDFDNILVVSWDANKPLSNTGWINSWSARGVKAGFKKIINDNFMAGADINWATYDQYQPTITMERTNGAFTTDYFKYVYSYGLTVNGQYLLPGTNRDHFMPYAGIGLGATYNSFNRYYNVYQDKEDSWGFLVRPEVGAIFPFSGKVGAIVGVHYDFSTSRSSYFNYNNFSNLGVQVGLAFLSY